MANHPRLWITPDDVPRLRANATDANPMWRDGLAQAATRAKQLMARPTGSRSETRRSRIRDRSRWAGEGFALTVDWAYPYFSAQDKKVRKVFARWADENEKADTTSHNHPEPPGVVNDPLLIKDTTLVRWAANNYYTAHMRNIGMMGACARRERRPRGQCPSLP